MSLITPEWKQVLTDHLNRKYNKTFKATSLNFTHNRYYTPVPGFRFIDVTDGDGSLLGRGTLVIEPYDVAKYFKSVPVVIYPEDDLTGSAIIDLIASNFGIVFDKATDIDPAFLTKTFAVSTVETIVVPFLDTSFVWSGSLNVLISDDGLNLPVAVKNRQLDALIYPDITEDKTQSLLLLTTPMAISDKKLVRKFSGTEPTTIDGDTLDRLMIEIQGQFIVTDPSLLGELRDLLRGSVFNSHPNSDPKYDRYTGPDVALKSVNFSGIPQFKFTYVEPVKDIGAIVGDIYISDDDQTVIDYEYTQIAAGMYHGNALATAVAAQAVNFEDDEDRYDEVMEIARIIRSGEDDDGNPLPELFSGYTRSTGIAVIEGQVRPVIIFTASPDSGYTGAIRVFLPLLKYAFSTETHWQHDNGSEKDGFKYIELEDESSDIELEDKTLYAGYTTSDGRPSTDLTTFVPTVSMDRIVTGLVLYKYDINVSRDELTLNADLVETKVDNGWSYTNPDYPEAVIITRPATGN